MPQPKNGPALAAEVFDLPHTLEAGIIASFLDAGEVDEFVIHTISKFIGEGIPLLAPARRTVPLKLLSSTEFPDGVVKLHYSVLK